MDETSTSTPPTTVRLSLVVMSHLTLGRVEGRPEGRVGGPEWNGEDASPQVRSYGRVISTPVLPKNLPFVKPPILPLFRNLVIHEKNEE